MNYLGVLFVAQMLVAYGDRLDKKVFPKTGKCYNCLQIEEIGYRINGQWENYEKMKLLKNKRGALEDFKEKVVESIHFLKNDSGKMGDVLSNGEIMTWTGKCNPQWLKAAEKDLVKVNEELGKMDKEITTLELEIKK